MSIIDISMPMGFKYGFQSSTDFQTPKFCFKYEYADNGKRCLVVGDDKEEFIRWFTNLPESKRKMYELIRDTDIVAEFYDVDLTIDEKEDVDELSFECIQDILDARNDVAKYNLSIKDFIVLSAHTPTKLSLHIISKKTYFKRNKIQEVFAKSVNFWLQKHESRFKVDISVYSNNRCFRMYKNHKYGKDNPLVLYKPEIFSFASFEDTWVVLTHRDLQNRSEVTRYNEEDVIMSKHVVSSERLTDDLDQKLQEFLKEHPYLQAGNDNRLNRVDNTRRKCLTDPKDFHSKENMFWFISNHHLYVHCFCKKGEPICLGMRAGLFKKEIPPEPFDYATHCSDDFKSYHDLKRNITTVFDKRRTGKGKTTSAMNFAKDYDKVLLIHNRLTLDSDYIAKYPEFVSYKSSINHDKQTVCFNSLGKIDTNRYELIIIDEIRSVMKQTEMKDMLHSTHTLFNILENQNVPVIMLDANLTNRDVEFIRKYRPDPNAVIIHDPYNKPDKRVFMVPPKGENALLSKIKQTIERGEKVVIIYNRSIHTINALLSAYTPTHRVLHVNKNTRSKINMDTSTWYDEYDIIAYSPTISEGVSINDPRFADVKAFGLFTSSSCPAESASQMIARFRAITHFTIYLDDTRARSIPKFTTIKEVLYYLNNNMNRLHSINDAHFNIERKGSQLKIIEDEFCELYCKNLLEQSLDYHNYYDTLVQKLVNNGYEVYDDTTLTLDEQEEEIIKMEVNILKEREHERIRQKILDSPNLSPMEYKTLIDIGVSNEDEECTVQKYNILHSINIDPKHLTLKMIQQYNNSFARTSIKNIKNCFSFFTPDMKTNQRIPVDVIIQDQVHHIVKECESKPNFLEQKQYVISFTPTRMDWLNKRIQELGFEYLYSPEGIPLEKYQHNLQRIVEYFKDPAHYKEYMESESLFGKFFSHANQEKLNESFLMTKLQGMFALKIGLDIRNGKAYQQCTLDIRLHDKEKEHPNVLGFIDLTNDFIRQYDIMFMKNIVKRCDACNQDFPNGLTLKHYSTKKHLMNVSKNNSS